MLFAFCLLLAGTKEQVPRLDLSCELNPAKSHLSVQCSVEVPPRYVKSGQVEFLLADQMSVPQVRLAGKVLEPKKKSQVDHDMTYSVDVPASSPGVKLDFSYESVGQKGMVFLLTPEECFAGGYNTLWFPALGENRRMEGTLAFTTPKDFLVKASGREVGSTIEGSVRRTEFRIDVPIVPTFAAAPFHVLRVPGDVPVTMYFLTPRPELAESFAKGCSAILRVLEKEFGPYPFPDFSIIETPSPISSDELGFTGASFEAFMLTDTDSLNAGFNLAHFGHEIGHQWWGNLVQMNNEGSSIFSEGLAQYGSLQAVRLIEGAPMARQYRLYGYPQFSDWMCTMGALAFRETGYDRALSFEPKGNSPIQHDLATTKGFLAFETLSRIMGRDNFRSALRQVVKDYAWSSLTWEQFWKILQSKSSVDLRPYRDQWFEKPGLPTTWTEWSQRGRILMVTLRQKEPAYRLRMPLVVRYKDGSSEQREVSFASGSSELVLRPRKDVLSVELDPDHETLHSTPELDAKIRDWKDFAQLDYINSKLDNPPDGEKLALEALSRLPHPDIHGAEFVLRFTLGGIYRSAGRNAEAKDQLEKALACPVRKEDFVPLAYLRLARANDALGNKDVVQRYLKAMVSAEDALPFPSGVVPRARKLFPNIEF